MMKICRDAHPYVETQCIASLRNAFANATDKYKGKYRIPSNRLMGYNYNANGCYYITICTKNREHYFGKIVDREMQLSEIGETAKLEWSKTAMLRPDMNLRLDESIVMPNHFHCIVFIDGNQYNMANASLPYKNSFIPQSKNISSIIRGFKSAVTAYARKHGIVFAWQERFHDIIIHDEEELNRVRSYIFENPQNWDKDECNE
ncbi:MAG: hypothetical protein FWC15_08035 [Fibromonadales bacterium]|nr:hypothetical protein [Fibromonadales bacterium]